VILVDDGLATGASMKAAVRALRRLNPGYISVAVPIGSRDTCDQFRSDVDELICGDTPEPFFAVGTWYANFLPTTDEEVQNLLDRAAHERRVRRVQEHKEHKGHEGILKTEGAKRMSAEENCSIFLPSIFLPFSL